MTRSGSLISVIAPASGRMTVRVTDARGMSVHEAVGNGAIAVDMRNLPAGVYTVSAACGKSAAAELLTVAK